MKMVVDSAPVNQLNALNSKKYNFFHSYRPVYYFARTFGFMPFTIVCDPNGTVHRPVIRWFDIFWFIISICVYLLAAFLSFKNASFSRNSDHAESVILLSADFFLVFSKVTFGVLFIVMDMFNRFKLVGILKNINTFDMEVSHLMYYIYQHFDFHNYFAASIFLILNVDGSVGNTI